MLGGGLISDRRRRRLRPHYTSKSSNMHAKLSWCWSMAVMGRGRLCLTCPMPSL